MVRVLIGLIATALIAQERGGVLAGVVVDEITGLPIAGASVGIGLVTELRSSASTKSDIDGNFRLAGVKPGRYWIDCSAKGYVTIAGYRLEWRSMQRPMRNSRLCRDTATAWRRNRSRDRQYLPRLRE